VKPLRLKVLQYVPVAAHARRVPPVESPPGSWRR
jgi:hypothetical protein